MTTSAIYGFEFTRPFEAHGLQFMPLCARRDDASSLARAVDAHRLTGTVSGANLKEDQVIYRLEAVLSFIERLDVRLTEVTDEPMAEKAPLTHFTEVMQWGKRPNHGGSAINPDYTPGHWDARRDFIDLAMARLADDAFCKPTKFRLLFIKAAESCRQRMPFIEGSYFLLMTGLEAFARAKRNDFSPGNAAQHMACVLKDYGFNVTETSADSSPRAISNYLHVRNSIFHNGELSKTVNVPNGGSPYTVRGEDFLIHLQLLVSLTVMKAIGFEDAHRNWDGWIDYTRPHGNFGQDGWSEAVAALQGS